MDAPQQRARELLEFIDASPTPWHAAANVASRLQAAGYTRLREADHWQLPPGARCFIIRDDSSLVAFRLGSEPLHEQGFRVIGAHTDSPGLRIKPRGSHDRDGMVRLGVEIYGSPILASFGDRDLGLAGRVVVAANTQPGTQTSQESRLVDFARPLLRLPNLAIHMNRTVNSDGLKLDPQQELPLLLQASEASLPSEQALLTLLAQALATEPGNILAYDLLAYDTQPGAFFGPQQEFIASARLDNLASCHAAVTALLASDQADAVPGPTAVCALFDHEEVGSTSAKGAAGSLLADCLERISLASGLDRQAHLRALAGSFLISADMAHAWQPNFPAAYDEHHRVLVNAGPVIKINASERYASNAASVARFQAWCRQAGVPWQCYVHRSNLPCGSTIGPLVASRLGMATVDVGNPMWAMHSARESAGARDHEPLIRVLQCFYG